MVIVRHSRLEERSTSGRLDPSSGAGTAQRRQSVIDGLHRHGPDACPRRFDYLLARQVEPFFTQHFQYRQSPGW
jgi:hypothetical protein